MDQLKHSGALQKIVAGISTVLLCCMVCCVPAAAGEMMGMDGKIIETIASGDYEYSILVNAEDETQHAACIERYTGSETNVVLPQTLDHLEVLALGDFAFAGNDTLQSVTLPKNMMGIGTYAFAECTALERFEVAPDSAIFESRDGVLYSHDGAWLERYPVTKIPKELEIPEGVTQISSSALAYGSMLERISLPESLTKIGMAAFSDCVSLQSIDIPAGVETIAAQTFYRCTALERISLPDTLTEIGAQAFAGCAFTEFTIPERCTTIGQAAFAVTRLSSITIPETVTSIGYYAFGYTLPEDWSGEFFAVDDFVIYGVAGSEAETYAKNLEDGNHFTFIASEASSTTTTIAASGDSTSSTSAATTTSVTSTTAAAPMPEKNRSWLIGVIIGSAVILAAIIFEIVLLLRKSKSSR